MAGYLVRDVVKELNISRERVRQFITDEKTLSAEKKWTITGPVWEIEPEEYHRFVTWYKEQKKR